jgi:hypothetical protein
MFYIDKSDWDKILNYARARQSQIEGTRELNHEIGGMLLAKKDKDDDWILFDPVILKQETSGGNCTIDKDELSKYYVQMRMKHGADIQYVWWHSHAKMAAFWSGTDKNTMTEYSSGSFSMFLVVNVRGEYKFRVQYWNPIELGEDIELNILGKTEEIPKDIIKEVKDLCSEERSLYTPGKYSYHNPNQLSLGAFGNRDKKKEDDEEMKSWNNSFNIGFSEDEAIINFIVRKLDIYNGQIVRGEIKHKMYRNKIKELNKLLKDKPSSYKVVLPRSNKDIDEAVTHDNIFDFIWDNDTNEPLSGSVQDPYSDVWGF